VLLRNVAMQEKRGSWYLASQFFIVLSVLLNDHVGTDELITYAGGSILSAITLDISA
jgi:hypothetical protein